MRWGDLIEVDWRRKQVRCLRQRIHHGPVGLIGGTILIIWGLTDLHDLRQWFRRAAQL